MKKLRTLVVVHSSLVPPENLEGHPEKEIEQWRTEYDVTSTLRSLSSTIQGERSDAEQQIGTIIRALLQRGLDDGTFRADLTVEELGFLLGQLLQAAARMTAEHVAGVEKAAALITSVFLHGTERRQDATAGEAG